MTARLPLPACGSLRWRDVNGTVHVANPGDATFSTACFFADAYYDPGNGWIPVTPAVDTTDANTPV